MTKKKAPKTRVQGSRKMQFYNYFRNIDVLRATPHIAQRQNTLEIREKLIDGIKASTSSNSFVGLYSAEEKDQLKRFFTRTIDHFVGSPD